MKITIISFSGRANGNCQKIAYKVSEEFSNENVEFYDFSSFYIHPCGACGLECFHQGEDCPFLEDQEYAMLDSVANSDLSVFVVPNYGNFPCSNFFVFSERSQCACQAPDEFYEKYQAAKKKFIAVSNTNKENFVSAFQNHLKNGTSPDILFLSARKYHQSSLAGELMDSADAREDLTKFLLY